MLNNTWKDYLNFAKRDRYGILYALFLLMVLIILPQIYGFIVVKNEQSFTNHVAASIGSYRTNISTQQEQSSASYSYKYKKNKNYKQNSDFEENNNSKVELFEFNPNELTKEKAVSLGLSEKVGSNIENYLKKGGKFFKTGDFKKIYSLKEADYERLKPYIVLPKKTYPKKKKDTFKNEKTENVAVELFEFNPNELTKEQAVSLGLSEKVGSNIENYLKKGGKFFKTGDFKKIYGMKESDYERLESYIVLPKKTYHKKKKGKFASKKTEKKEAELFDFDPNTVSIEEAERLGLSNKLATRLEKYRQKGGKFWKEEDFKRLYGLKESDYERLKPYIKIEKATVSGGEKEKMWATQKSKTAIDWKNFKIDINEADTSEWKKLSGIGKSFSARIVKYRTDLGGFVSKEQLKEVYGLDDELYAKIEPHLLPVEIGTVQPKLNLNACTAEMLWKHPYISSTVAKGIVKYRKQHGKFKDMTALKKLYLIDEELYEKIKIYFHIEK